MFDEDFFNNAKLGDMFVNSDRFVYLDDEDETIILTKIGEHIRIDHYAKNLQAIFDQNHAASMAFNATGRLGNQVTHASIPTTLYNDWKRRGIMGDEKLLRRHLNDSDYSKFRTNSLKV